MKYLIVVAFTLCGILDVWAQDSTSARHEIKEIKFSGGIQFWLRHTELNPGSTLQGTPVDQVQDISIRRIRFAMNGKLSEKWFFKVQLGANNISSLNPDANLNILDAEAIYAFKPWLQFGGGKTGYVGLSRYTAPATMAMVGQDWPIFAAPTINISDDLLRRMAILVKGQIGKLDYRSVISKPNKITSELNPSLTSNYSAGAPGLQRSAYMKYQFLDKESNTSAFSSGTYFGTKKIFNIGAGAMLQRDAFWRLANETDTIYHDMMLCAVDVFLDVPLFPDNAISFNLYGAYFNYDFGPNYIRNIGANNPADGVTNGSFNGKGNSFPAVGTGDIYFVQSAIRFATPNFITGLEGLQPYGAVQVADFEGLDDQMVVIDAGVAFLFSGHNSKFTAGYQNRPVFNETDGQVLAIDRMSSLVLQCQMKF